MVDGTRPRPRPRPRPNSGGTPTNGGRPKPRPQGQGGVKTPTRKTGTVRNKTSGGTGNLSSLDNLLGEGTAPVVVETSPKSAKRGFLGKAILGPGPKPDFDKMSDSEVAAWKKENLMPRRTFLGLAALAAVGAGGYYSNARWLSPTKATVPDKFSGSVSLKDWQSAVNNNSTESLKTFAENSYLAQETVYANLSDDRKAFISEAMRTVNYDIPKVDLVSTFGDVIEDSSGNPIKVESQLLNGESVELTIVDWNSVTFDKTAVTKFLTEYGLDSKNPDFQVKLTDAFAAYVTQLSQTAPSKGTAKSSKTGASDSGGATASEMGAMGISGSDKGGAEVTTGTLDDSNSTVTNNAGEGTGEYTGGLPLVKATWKPSMEPHSGTYNKKHYDGYRVSSEEDSRLDNVLFGSKALMRCYTRFSEVVTGEKASEEWYAYINAQDSDVKKPMPSVGNVKFIQPNWVGAYWMQVGMVKEAEKFKKTVAPISAPIGDGTKDAPAGLNTSIFTSIVSKGADGKVTLLPIRVELLEFLTDQKALDFFQEKDVRNRGLTTMSQIKYAAAKFKVTNLHTEDATIYDNSTLADYQESPTSSTGKMFGLQSSVTLKPAETGIIESWVGSPTLANSYFIWGKDFDRSAKAVWFRVLAAAEGTVTPKDSGDTTGGAGTDFSSTDIITGNPSSSDGGK